MARLIDADILKNRLDDMEVRGGHKYYREGMNVALHEFMPALIDEQPAIDAVEVVRCKDCAVPHNKWTGCPNLNGLIPPPEHFCARGERRNTHE